VRARSQQDPVRRAPKRAQTSGTRFEHFAHSTPWLKRQSAGIEFGGPASPLQFLEGAVHLDPRVRPFSCYGRRMAEVAAKRRPPPTPSDFEGAPGFSQTILGGPQRSSREGDGANGHV